MFNCHTLPIKENIFEELKASVGFEGVCKGREGTVLVKPAENGTPIVRTTTKYLHPPHRFQKLHVDLAEMIRGSDPGAGEFNNALIECYDNSYFRMGFHSDQAQDLMDGTCVAIFSCYKHPDVGDKYPRKLVVRPKAGSRDAFEVPMAHNSVVIFSLETNRRHQHKIVLDMSTSPPDNEWLGITFRASKTFVRHSENGEAHLEDGKRLVVADERQRKEFFKMRRRENQEEDFGYPELNYTISPSDLMLAQPMPAVDPLSELKGE